MIPGVIGQLVIGDEEEPEPPALVTWNSADKHADITLSNGDLTAAQTAGTDAPRIVRSTVSHTTGNLYFEFRPDVFSGDQFAGCGIARAGVPLTNYLGQQGGSAYSAGYYADGSVWQNGGGSGTSTGKPLSVSEWAAIAIDLDAGKAWVRDSTGWVGDPEAGTGNTITMSLGGAQVFAAFSGWDSGDQATANFGATAFQYTIPAGFISWDGSQEGLASGELSGITSFSFTLAADLDALGAGDLVGAATLTFTPIGDLAGSAALSGITSVTFTPAGNLGIPFTPTDLGADLELWYDASDTATITDAGSGAVSQFNDKSGNGNHLTQATGAARPITGTNTLNSLNVLTYAGTDDVLARTASVTVAALHQSGATLVIVRKYTASGSQGLFWTSTQSGSFGDNCKMGREGTVTGIWGNGTSSSAGLAAAYTDSDNTNWHINSGAFISAASREIFLDGTSQATNTSNSSSLTSPITGVLLGQASTTNRVSNMWLTGQIAEAILIVGSGSTNRQKLEGYVAHKWGLTANLPGGHPYKTNPP